MMTFANRMFVALATVGLLSAPALADARRPSETKPAQKKAKAPNMGASFELGPRHAALPSEDDEPVIKARPRPLSEGQVTQVVMKKLGDVQYCWNRLPAAARRVDTTAVLRFSVQITGVVGTVDVAGEVPPSAQKCIAAAAGRWTFPVAETQSDIEYAVALRAM
jgi:hypothetical protein